MAYATGFWNFIAERYAKKPVPDEELYQKKLEATRRYLKPDMEVFEFGCGTGSTAIIHAPYVKHYLAIDVSPKMIAIANRKLGATDINNLTFEVGALEEYQCASESYDAVLGMSILHLLEDPDKAIEYAHKMLKPGGIFVSSTVCAEGGGVLMSAMLSVVNALKPLPSVKCFSPQSLEARINKVGFKTDFCILPRDSDEACFLVSIKQ